MKAKPPRVPIRRLLLAAAALGAAASLGAAAVAASGPAVVFACQDGTRLSISFNDRVAVLHDGSGNDVALEQQASGSGFRYAGAGHDLRGKGDEVTWTAPDHAPRQCKAVGADAGAQEQDGAALGGTRWQLVQFRSRDAAVGTVRPPDPERFVLEFLQGGRLALRMDCSRAVGRWRTLPVDAVTGRLELQPAGSARQACPAGSVAAQIADAALQVRDYRLEGDRLHTKLAKEAGTYTWRRLP
ncbi:META domain-containing protein [Zavarzinia sp. CC-PAN008]|uniref:META domain-containing protein n=1 Tax=Zavarzinia sp. CC-PAN008 TaxID=3243332 RepID=UPI003F7483BA